MTSIPASRNARAMTFAPRSWPSRPGLAITTRILFIRPQHAWSLRTSKSNRGHFFILAPHFTQRVAHLADRRVRPDALQERVHRIRDAARGVAQVVQAAPD